MTYPEIISLLSQNLLIYFDEVYHSAEIIENDAGIKQPAIALNDEWISLVPTDQRETLYIRRNGADEVQDEFRPGSCLKGYNMRTPLRIVYFKDHAKNHSKILSNLLQSVLANGSKLRSITLDKWKLQKEESSGDYNFGANTAYFAVDILASWVLIPSSCEEDFCADIPNPLIKTSCPAVA